MRLFARLMLVASVTFLLAILQSVRAQGTTLELTKTLEGNITDIDAGEVFNYILQYRCVNIIGTCENVTVTDILPPELSANAEDVIMIGSPHVINTDYNPATRTATWIFINPLPAGSTGELKLAVKFPAGFTPESTTTTNQAEINGSNSGSPVNSNSTIITAHATNQLFTRKSVFGGVPDVDTTYNVEFCRPSAPEGQLNMANITMIDTLPAGVTFVGASDGGVYNAGPPATVTWSLPNFDVNDDDLCMTRTVTVRFESANGWNVGDTATNSASVTGTPTGQTTPVTSSTTITHNIVGAQPSASFAKTTNRNEGTWGEIVRYGFELSNTGNVPLDNFIVTDVIADQLNVVSVHTGRRVSSSVPVTIRYQTNLNGAWTPVAGSPFTSQTNVPITLPAGEYVTVLQWDYGTLQAGYTSTGSVTNLAGFSAEILQTDRQGNTVTEGDVVENVADLDYSYGGTPFGSTSQRDVIITLPTARPAVRKDIVSGSPAKPGDIMTYRLRIRNDATATANLVNPVAVDLLDTDVEYVSWTFNPNSTPAPAPNFELIDNYNGTGRTLLRWSWTGSAAYTFTPGQEVQILTQLRVKQGTPASANQLQNIGYIVDWSPTIPRTTCLSSTPDVNDLDGDGNTAELICRSNQVQAPVLSQAVMESLKWVRGNLDNNWKRYPDVGNITPGGIFEYRVVLENVGNVPTTNITIIDVLPHLNDTGVIDPSQRNSEWEPLLAEPIVVPPGVTVEYSTAINPCRPELVPAGPVGCNPPGWSTVPPADITLVRAIRFNLGAIIIAPLQSFELTWKMRAPQNVQAGRITWNSFGYVATRVDDGTQLLPSEPLKVGVSPRPAPLSGGKAFVSADPPLIEWKMVWINNRNAFPVTAQVLDPLPHDVVYANGSLSCDARGSSGSQVCEYDAANHQIVWRGVLGADLGATSEYDALHELVITFRFGIYGDNFAPYTNQASSMVDTDNDGSFTNEPPSSSSLTNAAIGGLNSPDNSRAAAALTVPGIPTNVTFGKTASSFFGVPGSPIDWTLTVVNGDPFPANNVIVVDNVPDILEVLGASSTVGSVSISGQTVTFTAPVLAAGETAIITIQSRIRANAQPPFIIDNHASLSISNQMVKLSSGRVLSATKLPTTGYSPLSSWRLMAFSAIGSLLLTVIGLALTLAYGRRKSLSS